MLGNPWQSLFMICVELGKQTNKFFLSEICFIGKQTSKVSKWTQIEILNE